MLKTATDVATSFETYEFRLLLNAFWGKKINKSGNDICASH